MNGEALPVDPGRDSGEILTYYVECLRIAEDKQISETLLWPLHTAVVEIDQYVMRVHAA